MKLTLVVLLQSLLIAWASIAPAHADEAIGPGHPRWYGNGSGPVGADLIAWVAQHATKAAPGAPDPAYYGIAGGPTGADLIAKLASVQKRDVKIDLVNVYGQGAPSARQLASHRVANQPVYAGGPTPVVK